MNNKNIILRILITLNNISWYFLWISLIIIIPIAFLILKETSITEIWLDTPISYLLLTYTWLSDVIISIFLFLEIEIILLLALYITYNFKKLFQNLRSKNVFVQNNVKYIKNIAYISLVITIFWFDITNLFFALIFLLFAKIFEYGMQLENEKQLTI